ncbi:MAG: mechanosensitive ion channel, partial [Burkholderiales bacterium]
VAQQLGVGEQFDLPRLTGVIVFLLIFVPALISALEALRIEAISGPATGLLRELIAAVPELLAATLIIVVTYYVARFAAALATSLLSGLGLDQVPERIGIGTLAEGMKLSELIGRLIVFFAMLFAAVEAADRLQFGEVRDLVSTFIAFGADVLLGAVILVIGFWLANLISDAVGRSDRSGSTWLAGLVRALVIGLVIAMGLRAMGIADSIVNLAFGLTLGAVAVAVALAFGLGGREAAGKLMEHWLSKLRRE